jgi:hypothetical protein
VDYASPPEPAPFQIGQGPARKSLNHQRTCMEVLKSELAEIIRKSDHRFRDEIMGKAGDSYKRTADFL